MKRLLLVLFIGCWLCSCKSPLYHSVYRSRSTPSHVYPNLISVKPGQIDSAFNCRGQYTVGGFYMSQFEITNAQYAYYLNKMRDTSWFYATSIAYFIHIDSSSYIQQNEQHEFVVKEGYENYPVTNVPVTGARYYGKWLTAELSASLHNKKYFYAEAYYRIPAEEEWYYAATAGGINIHYSGNEDANLVAWYAGNSTSLHAAGLKKPNRFGFYDMSGNAAEWCLPFVFDEWLRAYPSPKEYGARGGSFLSDSTQLKMLPCPPVYTISEDSTSRDLGFRIAQTRLYKKSKYDF